MGSKKKNHRRAAQAVLPASASGTSASAASSPPDDAADSAEEEDVKADGQGPEVNLTEENATESQVKDEAVPDAKVALGEQQSTLDAVDSSDSIAEVDEVKAEVPTSDSGDVVESQAESNVDEATPLPTSADKDTEENVTAFISHDPLVKLEEQEAEYPPVIPEDVKASGVNNLSEGVDQEIEPGAVDSGQGDDERDEPRQTVPITDATPNAEDVEETEPAVSPTVPEEKHGKEEAPLDVSLTEVSTQTEMDTATKGTPPIPTHEEAAPPTVSSSPMAESDDPFSGAGTAGDDFYASIQGSTDESQLVSALPTEGLAAAEPTDSSATSTSLAHSPPVPSTTDDFFSTLTSSTETPTPDAEFSMPDISPPPPHHESTRPEASTPEEEYDPDISVADVEQEVGEPDVGEGVAKRDNGGDEAAREDRLEFGEGGMVHGQDDFYAGIRDEVDPEAGQGGQEEFWNRMPEVTERGVEEDEAGLSPFDQQLSADTPADEFDRVLTAAQPIEGQAVDSPMDDGLFDTGAGQDDDLFGDLDKSGNDAAPHHEDAAEALFGQKNSLDSPFLFEEGGFTPLEDERIEEAEQDKEELDLDAMGVPEGWLDTDGSWNWYTEDERMEVGRGMAKAVPDTIFTPEPAPQPVTIPPVTARNAAAPNLWTPAPITYTPSAAPVQSSQAPSSSYSPYAPAPRAVSSASAYSPANGGYNPPTSAYGQRPVTTSTAPSFATPPAPLVRTSTPTAYDPPILKTARVLHRAPSVAVMSSPFGMPSPSPYGLPSVASPLAPPPLPSRGVPPQGLPSALQARPALASRDTSSTLTANIAPTAFDPPIMPLNRYASQARLRASPQPISHGNAPPMAPPPPQRQLSPRPPNYTQPPPTDQPSYFSSPPIGLPPSSIDFPSQSRPPPSDYGFRQTLSPPPQIPYNASEAYATQPGPLAASDRQYTQGGPPRFERPQTSPAPPAVSHESYERPTSSLPLPNPYQARPQPDTYSGTPPKPESHFSPPRAQASDYNQSGAGYPNNAYGQPSSQGTVDEIDPSNWPSPLSQRGLRERTPIRANTYASPARQVTAGFAVAERRPDQGHNRYGSSGSTTSDAELPSRLRQASQSSSHLSTTYEPPQMRSSSSGEPHHSFGTAQAYSGDAFSAGRSAAFVGRHDTGEDLDAPDTQPNLSSSYDPYATSEQPSLEDDVLRRGSARRVPCISFGPRGQFVTAFQPDKEGGMPSLTAASAYGETSQLQLVSVRTLNSMIGEGAMSAVPVPKGPFIHDPATPKSSANDKKRREAILAYLDNQIDVTSAGISYLALKAGDLAQRQRAQAGLILLRLIRLLVQHDGSLLTRDLEATLSVLSPADISDDLGSLNGPSNLVGLAGHDNIPSAQDLADLSRLLAHGRKADAVNLATERRLWSHALIMSSATSPECWAKTIQAFLASAFADRQHVQAATVIKASYILVANADPELASKALREQIDDQEVLAAWQGIAATVIGNSKGQAGALLSDLGDRLRALKCLEASHVCFLLSAASTPNPPQAPVTNKALPYGYETATYGGDALLQSELVEFAYSLRPVSKGVDATHNLEGLLPHKINKAAELYEVGHFEEAERYFDSVTAILRVTRSIPSARADQLTRRLADIRNVMQGAESTDSAGKKLAKPNLHNVGSWFEGRLTKFIAGEEPENQKPAEETPKDKSKALGSGAIGPFSHYSSIAPDAPVSGGLARATSSFDLSHRYAEPVPPVPRSGSAMAYRQPPVAAPSYRPTSAMSYRSATQQNQSLSAIRSRSPINPDREEEVPTVDSRRGSSRGTSTYGDELMTPTQPTLAVPSWGQSYDFEDTGSQPPASEPSTSAPGEGFLNPMQAMMPAFGPAAATTPAATSTSRDYQDEEDDDELGLGNTTSKAKANTAAPPAQPVESVVSGEDAYSPKPVQQKEEPVEEKKDSAPTAASTGSWIGKFWGGSKAEKKPGPLRAKLGEETSMVFDPVQKRWVTKGAAGQAEVAKPPPPPPRSTTASPATQPIAAKPPAGPPSSSRPPSAMSGPSGMATPSPPAISSGSGGAPPPPSSGPPRPASAMSGPPSRPPTSNSNDPPGIDALAPPPPRKGGAGGAKKNIRSRYVDVFQQP